MMDLTLMISFVTISLFPGYGFSCKTDDAFESECMTPYNNYLTTNFWTNICSDQGKLVYSCILAQNNCPTENAVQTTFLEKFKARFDPYKMNIGFACEYQNTVCQGVTLCVPSSIYGFQGVTVYDFYKYFCGPEVSLWTMFKCLADLQPSCPVTVEQFSTYQLNTPSGLLSYSSLATNTLAECAKIGDEDVQCIQSKVGDIAQCGIISTINMTFLTMNCQYTSKTKACVSAKCGASVATFYDAMYTFLNCFLNNGEWSGWTGWSTCTLTCGQGITLRTRDCSIGPISGEQVCEGESTEIKDCTITECPVDGQFGFWGYWSECNQNCGGGSRTRTRSCNNPTPANGGKDCEGDKSQSELCNEQQCAGDYGLWSVWSTCSKSCGQGSQSRTRTCEGGGSCSGPSSESKYCTVQECPGEYGLWSEWSTCSTTCGKGSQSRTRTCEGGGSCSGSSSESEDCIVQECHVDGAFSDWEVWTICSKTCGGGIRTRARTSFKSFSGFWRDRM
ncbi:A disintegrin and metalloproteinase with thrombospondin motifs adt-1-like [Ruditapes philippinarum]|uniref:A disintegrin and metalloproteinase with thrombospondin motifs adt-1-like n=1 Tax=Ruditapes philippinarum TaxID=129788 RepID=UPI00295A7BED|nr:A disintegrin and metalloproteinase with thrombospondin motifs adt-1-like [Ruditapes philippinarum]